MEEILSKGMRCSILAVLFGIIKMIMMTIRIEMMAVMIRTVMMGIIKTLTMVMICTLFAVIHESDMGRSL